MLGSWYTSNNELYYAFICSGRYNVKSLL